MKGKAARMGVAIWDQIDSGIPETVAPPSDSASSSPERMASLFGGRTALFHCVVFVPVPVFPLDRLVWTLRGNFKKRCNRAAFPVGLPLIDVALT